MTSHALDHTPVRSDALLYKVADVVRMLSIGRTVVFEQLRTGRLRSVKQGRLRLIPAAALQDYVDLLISEAHGGT